MSTWPKKYPSEFLYREYEDGSQQHWHLDMQLKQSIIYTIRVKEGSWSLHNGNSQLFQDQKYFTRSVKPRIEQY